MPHNKSAAKRVITNEKSRARNVAARTRMRGAIRGMRGATTRAEAAAAYRNVCSVLDRVAAKGIIKKETASRQKARLARFAAKLPA